MRLRPAGHTVPIATHPCRLSRFPAVRMGKRLRGAAGPAHSHSALLSCFARGGLQAFLGHQTWPQGGIYLPQTAFTPTQAPATSTLSSPLCQRHPRADGAPSSLPGGLSVPHQAGSTREEAGANVMQSIHKTEYYSALKREGVQTPATTWMKLKDITLRETSQFQRTTYHVTPLYEMPRIGEPRDRK